MDRAAPRRAAREAADTTWFRLLARAGYGASGLVHLLIGVIALIVAFGGDATPDQSGALRAIAGMPFGFAVLWTVAVALWALGAWKIVEGILVRGTPPLRRWMRRLGQWGQGVVFAAIGGIAAAVAMGARVSSEEATEAVSRGVLRVPGGVYVLAAAAIVVGAVGISFLVMGLRRSYRTQVRVPDGALGAAIDVLGVVGFVAKGVALAAVGVLLVIASIRGEAKTAGGLDGALTALLRLSLGPVVVGTIGAGLIAYGVFCFFRAKYARL